MRIGLQTWGSDGDIYPFIALAGGLAAAGHEVTLALTSAERKDYGALATRLGFRLITVGYIGKDVTDLQDLSNQVRAARSPLEQLDFILDRAFEAGVDSLYETSKRLCARNDLMIGHFLVHPAQAAAEKAHCRYLSVALNHGAIPSRYLPLMGMPALGPMINGLLWKVGLRILNRHIAPHINRLRRREGLPPVASFREVWESRLANLIAVSPSLCRRPPDWAPHHQLCGFFNLPDEARPWEMPVDLRSFLDEGPPPVYMTFGSMLAADVDVARIRETTAMLVAAAIQAGSRAIIQSRWQEIADIPEHPDIYRITSAPHTKIFPHCAAVVHHGGAGTTQTATLCGCPSVIVAHISDQYFWARELKRLQLAPAVLERRTLTAKKLACRMRRVLRTPAMTENAQRYGRMLAAENGVGRAVAVIEGLFNE